LTTVGWREGVRIVEVFVVVLVVEDIVDVELFEVVVV
jgi:hypothetical protein